MDKIKLYLKESYNELLHKVTWPSWSQLVVTSNVVLISSLIIAALIFVMDMVSKTIMDFIYGLA